MKKLTLIVAFSMLLQLAFAGGLLTNYNQSAQYIRMLSRNAALEIDAVFYNPAGLVKMEDGWHFAFYSQTILQTRDIDTQFPTLNSGHYTGETTIPVYPDIYAVYKKNNWAYSIGIGPIGGGGTAEFAGGIPTLEIPFSLIPGQLSGLGQIDPALAVTSYDLDMALEASSTFWGIQLGASYAVNDQFSFYGGLRLMPSTNKYDGAIRNIQLNGVDAATWLNGASGQVNGFAGQASAGADLMYGTASTMQPVIDAGYGTATLADLENGGVIDATTRAQIEGGLQLIGVPQAQINVMNALQVQGTYSAAGDELTSTATLLSGTAQTLAGTATQVGDKEVKTKQKGMGFTPIIGFNYSPNNDWTFALKYEFETKLTLENETEVDDMGLFPDGAESSNDIPAILTTGIGYRGLDWLEAQLSFNMYFDKGVDYGNNIRYSTLGEQVHRDIESNYTELALGLQFNVAENFAFSVGGMRSKNGVTPQYQSDFSYSNSSYTLAGGIMWNITDKLTFDAGVANTMYEDDTVTFTHAGIGSYDETYAKTTISMSAGISYSIF
ncbi:OmpP1/FadL family transporter [Draconibacterium halophilum]|uniref:Long-chain fatty acid transport protein n=1 Tax=Draconibacterium halophilum TaxID=2706887 RepID=A0A6C0RA90_9BACT|nr:hypothetical protein [Draconibacterium halophilum]QIA07314.1 hypothetical protein G0Q07_06050 [Draconibacterium halophilum]